MNFSRTIIVSSIMLLTIVFMQFINKAEDVHPNKPLSTFPMKISEWSGKTDRFENRVYEVLGVDDSLLAHYYDPLNRYVQLYIGFYQSQREGDLIHSPKNCMPGGGWNIEKIELEEVRIAEPELKKIKVVNLILENGNQKQSVLYWYHSRGRIISSEYLQKIYLVVDSITKRRTDGSFVRLIAPVTDGNEEKATNYLKEFAGELYPILTQYIPS